MITITVNTRLLQLILSCVSKLKCRSDVSWHLPLEFNLSERHKCFLWGPKLVHCVRIRNGPLLGIPCYVVKSPDLGSVMLSPLLGAGKICGRFGEQKSMCNVQMEKMRDPKTPRLWGGWRTFVLAPSLQVVGKSILPWQVLLKQVKPHNQHQRQRYIL